MQRENVLTITPINELVLAKGKMGLDSFLTILRLFKEPEIIFFKEGVGNLSGLAGQLLGNSEFNRVASAGRLGRDIKRRGGVLIYTGGVSLMNGENPFVYNSSEFIQMVGLIGTIMGSKNLVNIGRD